MLYNFVYYVISIKIKLLNLKLKKISTFVKDKKHSNSNWLTIKNVNYKSQFLLLFTFFSCTISFASDTLPSENVSQLLSQILRFRSLSGHEKPVGKFLYNKSIEMGLSVHLFNDSDSSFNFSASLYPLEEQKPNIVFLCHLDVVPAIDSAEWKHPPFSGEIIHDTVWGRGCLDMKGIGLMQLEAVAAYLKESKEKSLPYNFTVLFVSGEENGGRNGAKLITENNLPLLNVSLIIGEGGAGLKGVLPSKPDKEVFFVSMAEKQSLWLKLSVHQKTHGHSSMPSSNTANRILIKAIDRIEDEKPIIIFDKTTKKMFRKLGKLNGGAQGFVLKNINGLFRPFRRKILSREPMLLNEVTNTIQLTNFSNPFGPPNVIPGTATAYFDCRLVPDVSTKIFIRKLKLRIHNPKVEIETIDQSPDEVASVPNEKYKAIKSALKKAYPDCAVLPVLFPATTDNSYFRAKQITAYGLLPIELNQQLIESVHSANECIPVSTLNKGIEAYKLIIRELINTNEPKQLNKK